MENELYHYGVLGMRWGVRKSLDSASKKSVMTIDKVLRPYHTVRANRDQYLSDRWNKRAKREEWKLNFKHFPKVSNAINEAVNSRNPILKAEKSLYNWRGDQASYHRNQVRFMRSTKAIHWVCLAKRIF